jgi:hypothetical protein
VSTADAELAINSAIMATESRQVLCRFISCSQ